MIDGEYSRFTVNVYDFFANIIPGVIFIIGVILPFWDGKTIPSLEVVQGIFFGLIAFVIGAGLQSVGSKIKRYHFWPFPSDDKYERVNGKYEIVTDSRDDEDGDDDELRPLRKYVFKISRSSCIRSILRLIIRKRILPFNNKMDDLYNSEEDSLPFAEEEFFNSCREIFAASGNDSEKKFFKNSTETWEYLFKMIFSYLETHPSNRAVRIQAQHLGTRGLYVSFFLISIWYLIGGVIELCQVRLEIGLIEINQIQLESRVLWILALLTLITSIVFYVRSVHFEEDMVRYMIIETNILSNQEDRI